MSLMTKSGILDKIAQDHQIQEIDLRADLEKQYAAPALPDGSRPARRSPSARPDRQDRPKREHVSKSPRWKCCWPRGAS